GRRRSRVPWQKPSADPAFRLRVATSSRSATMPGTNAYWRRGAVFAGAILGALALLSAWTSGPERTMAGERGDEGAKSGELQMEVLQKPRVVAAGTATFERARAHDNTASVRVKLDDDIAARIGSEYIVLLTNRYPTGGFPYFVPYWKPARDGFDISLVDVSLANGSTTIYANRNRTYLIDWVVLRKDR